MKTYYNPISDLAADAIFQEIGYKIEQRTCSVCAHFAQLEDVNEDRKFVFGCRLLEETLGHLPVEPQGTCKHHILAAGKHRL